MPQPSRKYTSTSVKTEGEGSVLVSMAAGTMAYPPWPPFEIDEMDQGRGDEDLVEGSMAAGSKVYEALRKRGMAKNGRDEVTHDVLQRPGRLQQVTDNVRVKAVVVGEGEHRRRYVVCHWAVPRIHAQVAWSMLALLLERIIEQVCRYAALKRCSITLLSSTDGKKNQQLADLLSKGAFSCFLPRD